MSYIQDKDRVFLRVKDTQEVNACQELEVENVGGCYLASKAAHMFHASGRNSAELPFRCIDASLTEL